MASSKTLDHKKVRKILDKNDDLVNKTVEKGQELTEKVLDRNRDIWLAGLGAFSKARDESGELFNKLIETGEKFENKYKKIVDDNSDSAIKKVTNLFDKVPSPSNKIEDVFDSRVAKALKRLGVMPTVNALQSLAEQVESLNSLIEEYVDTTPEKKAKKTAAKKPATKKAATKKPVAKKAVAKKPAAKRTATAKAAPKKVAEKQPSLPIDKAATAGDVDKYLQS